jgi:hypothetical protein
VRGGDTAAWQQQQQQQQEAARRRPRVVIEAVARGEEDGLSGSNGGGARLAVWQWPPEWGMSWPSAMKGMCWSTAGAAHRFAALPPGDEPPSW